MTFEHPKVPVPKYFDELPREQRLASSLQQGAAKVLNGNHLFADTLFDDLEDYSLRLRAGGRPLPDWFTPDLISRLADAELTNQLRKVSDLLEEDLGDTARMALERIVGAQRRLDESAAAKRLSSEQIQDFQRRLNELRLRAKERNPADTFDRDFAVRSALESLCSQGDWSKSPLSIEQLADQIVHHPELKGWVREFLTGPGWDRDSELAYAASERIAWAVVDRLIP